MPAVTEEAKRRIRVNKRTSALRIYLKELMSEKDRNQKACAAVLGKTQQSFSYALKNMSFSVTELVALLDYLGADQSETADILAKGGKA